VGGGCPRRTEVSLKLQLQEEQTERRLRRRIAVAIIHRDAEEESSRKPERQSLCGGMHEYPAMTFVMPNSR
jgi:hypothetical protein